MPFKIVQTIEEGKIKLTTVPEQWEQNGVLYWPKSTKKLEKRRKDEHSVPDYTSSNWLQINCRVKRKNIHTFHKGESEIGFMSGYSETETDDTENQIPNKTHLPKINFNDMAEAVSTSSKTQSVDLTKAIDFPIIHITEKDLIYEPVLLQEELKENENVGTVSVTEIEAQSKSILEVIKTIQNDMQTVKTDIQTINTDIQTVTENQSVLSSNQNTIIAQISELSIKFEEFIKLSLGTKKNTNPGESGIVKIHNEKTLAEFERKLDDPDSRDDLYRQYSVILNKGAGKGTTNAYTLVDAMFERNFFTLCSWTGVSKGDVPKLCFKGFIKTIQFFFNIVHESDTTFTQAQLAKFFKIVLRNSRYRSQNEQARMSTQRQKSKLKTKKSLPNSLQDDLENSPKDQNQRELPDLEGDTNQLRSVPLLQENHQNKSADGEVEVVDKVKSKCTEGKHYKPDSCNLCYCTQNTLQCTALKCTTAKASLNAKALKGSRNPFYKKLRDAVTKCAPGTYQVVTDGNDHCPCTCIIPSVAYCPLCPAVKRNIIPRKNKTQDEVVV